MSFWSDLFEMAFPLVLKGVKGLADSQVKGEDLNEDQKKLLYAGYVVIAAYGPQLAEDTSNPYDDAGLQTLLEFAEDTLMEAGVPIPDIPF